MKQPSLTPTRRTPSLSLSEPRQHPLPPPTSAPLVLHMAPGQGQLVWLDAGCELRCLSGTAVLHNTSSGQLGEAPPARLPAHAAWRSPQGAWLGVAAGDAPVALQVTGSPHQAAPPAAHEESRPGRLDLQRLWRTLKKSLARRAQPAG